MRAYKIRIVLAESRPVVQAGLQKWFSAHARFHIAACTTDGPQLLAELASVEYDLIVLSGGIEGCESDGFARLRALRELRPDTPVIVFLDDPDVTALATLQRAGATGLVSTLDEARAFERVCDRALSGAKHVVSPRIAACSQPADVASPAESSPDYSNMRMNIRQFIGRN